MKTRFQTFAFKCNLCRYTVAATAEIVAQIARSRDPAVTPSEYATSVINQRVLTSSDPALAAMCPELSPAQRRAWIL